MFIRPVGLLYSFGLNNEVSAIETDPRIGLTRKNARNLATMNVFKKNYERCKMLFRRVC